MRTVLDPAAEATSVGNPIRPETVLGASIQEQLELDLSRKALRYANDFVVCPRLPALGPLRGHGHEVRDPNDATGRVIGRLEHIGAGDVASFDLVWMRECQAEPAAAAIVHDRPKNRRAVEPRQTEPADGPAPAHERRGPSIADQGIIGDQAHVSAESHPARVDRKGNLIGGSHCARAARVQYAMLVPMGANVLEGMHMGGVCGR